MNVKIVPDKDEFCETCKITLARKANRGKKPLENLGPPGQMIMIDIIPSPATRLLTPDTYHKYYLGIIDVASRFFVPMGIQDKMPKRQHPATPSHLSSKYMVILIPHSGVANSQD
jgi:hypothetical protein